MTQNPGVAMVLTLALSAALVIPAKALYGEQGIKKPSLTLKATPAVSFAPARIVVVAEVKGGPNDFEEFYCPSIEWDWGDFTSSTAEADCEPYETGKSEIKRRYTIEHRYKNPGGYKIVLRLKKGNKIIATANAMVQVRAGLGQ
jgi:hypothetical protein